MRLLITDTKITGQLTTALCDTLIYSLWQGILLAAVVGLVVVFTKRLSAALRYKLLVSALLFFAVGVIATFVIQFETVVHAVQVSQLMVPQPENSVALQTYQPAASTPATGFMGSITGYLNSHSNAIVLAWFLIICAKSIQLGVGLLGTYRLKYTGVSIVDGHWRHRVWQLAGQLGIRRGIRLMESSLAKVPLVIGHLKPVILIPLGLLTALPSGEIEAILVHELAHIRRHDFLVNLLQSLMEIVFFFNPAVLWVSQLLKTERENCCDDLAISKKNNKANYIRALLSCEEYRLSAPTNAMAFPGNKHGLLQRVKRMASSRNHSLNVLEKTLLAVCLVLSGICVFAFSKKPQVKHTSAIVATAPQDTIPLPKKQGDSVTAKGTNAAITPVPPKSVADSVSPKTSNVHAVRENVQPKAIDKHDTIVKNPGLVTVPALKYDSEWVAAGKNNVRPYNPTPKAYSALTNAYQKNQDANAGSSNTHKDSGHDYKPSPGPYGYNYPAGRYRGAAGPYGTDLQRKNEALLAEIMDDMFREGIITQKNNLDFKLTEKEFIVNGQQQDDAIFQRYRDKYVPHENANGWTWTQSRHVPSLLVEITDDMFREGIITQKNSFDFKLTDKEFIVNGQQQDDAIFQRYRNKYVPHENANGWTWTQSHHVPSSSR